VMFVSARCNVGDVEFPLNRKSLTGESMYVSRLSDNAVYQILKVPVTCVEQLPQVTLRNAHAPLCVNGQYTVLRLHFTLNMFI